MDEEQNTSTKNVEDTTVDNDSSFLSLSLTPPHSPSNNTNVKADNTNKSHSDNDISEHLNSDLSAENDRSLREIQIDNLIVNLNYDNFDNDNCQNISQELKPLDFTLNSDDSGNANVKSILDEILNNDQLFDSHNESLPKRANDTSLSLSNDFDIFANVDFDDEKAALYGKCDVTEGDAAPQDGAGGELLRKLREMEQILAVKESTIAALSSELDSLREFSNNTASYLSTTEYKQLQDEFNVKIMEYNNAIYEKNDLIQKLSDSLKESLNDRKDLISQIDVFKSEIVNLQQQLKSASEMLQNQHGGDGQSADKHTEKYHDSLESDHSKEISKSEVKTDFFAKSEVKPDFASKSEVKTDFAPNTHAHDLNLDKIDVMTDDVVPAAALHALKRDMEERHAREMSELRQYFERKCADLEKNYSEEIFSQHSRKMSDSSEHDVNSDAIYMSPVKSAAAVGPAGDVAIQLSANFTSQDVAALKTELSKILFEIDNYDIANLTDADLDDITCKVNACNFDVFLKYDLAAVKREMKRKFDSELALMRSDFDAQMAAAQLDFEERVRSLEQRHLEDINNLNKQVVPNVVNDSQEVSGGASGDFEITEVIQSYERRLQEQIALAKIDILNALQCQIQELAENDSMDDEEWPVELVQLRNQFRRKYELRISEMEQRHEEEVRALKAEHVKIMGGALERARRQSLKDSLDKNEMELVKERDSLKKQSIALRHLLAELLKYFTQCEDALNATLVDELLKINLDRSFDESTLNESSTSSGDTSAISSAKRRRVHLTPNFHDIIALIESVSKNDESLDDKDISVELQTELANCLQQLRRDANDILLMTAGVRKIHDSTDSVMNPHETPFERSAQPLESSAHQFDNSAQHQFDISAVRNEILELDDRNSDSNGIGVDKLPFDISNVTLDRPSVNSESPLASRRAEMSNLNEKINSLTRKLIGEVQEKNRLQLDLDEALLVIKALESEKVGLDRQLDDLVARENHLVADLAAANSKIAELIESGHREIISEGYGEQEAKEGGRGVPVSGEKSSIHQLAELQEEARAVLAQTRKTADAQLLRLLEELCQVGEAIKEEAKRERADLQQQVEILVVVDPDTRALKIKAADNKYRATQKFLEEQAVEREMERDEAQKRIDALQELLRDSDRDKMSRELISSQVAEKPGCCRNCKHCKNASNVEQYESQVVQLQQRLDGELAKYRILEDERNEAVDKIKTLRDIIRELEAQVEAKSSEIEKFIATIEKLQSIIENQARESDSESGNSDLVQRLRAHIAHLENEAEQLRIAAEFVGSESCAQVFRNRLLEFEIALDRKTKVLESLFQNPNNSCSSPSEDISVRELLNPSIYDSELVYESETGSGVLKTRPRSAKSLQNREKPLQNREQSLEIDSNFLDTSGNPRVNPEKSGSTTGFQQNPKSSPVHSPGIGVNSRTNTPESQRIACESLDTDSNSSKLEGSPVKSPQIPEKIQGTFENSSQTLQDLPETTLESTGTILNSSNQSEISRKSHEIAGESHETRAESPKTQAKMSDVDRKLIDADCQVPLQQLARLKDKLLRHSRAEDSALKRIRDLEMQVFNLRTELEENQNDKEYLKNSVQEQLVLISDLQIRLDEQRIRAEHIEKCANTSLESKIYDLQNEVLNLEEKLAQKEKTVASLEKKLAETQKRIRDLEEDAGGDSELVAAMQQELEKLRKDYDLIKYKSPEKLISAKNAEIRKLENELKFYRELNLNRNDLKNLSSLKGSSLLEGLSLIELSNSEVGRRATSDKSAENSLSFFPRKTPEISAIGSSSLVPLVKPNSTEIYRTSGGKRVHFADDTEISLLRPDVSQIADKSEIDRLNAEIKNRDETIKDLQEKLKFLNQLEEKIGALQANLEQTESALDAATKRFESEQLVLLNEKNRLEKELEKTTDLAKKSAENESAKSELSELKSKMEVLSTEWQRKDEMYLEMLQKLRHEKQELETELATVKNTAYKNLDCVIKEKNAEIDELKLKVANPLDSALIAELEQKVDELSSELSRCEENLADKVDELAETRENLSKIEKDLRESEKKFTETSRSLAEKDELNRKLSKEAENNLRQLESAKNDYSHVREKLHRKRKTITDLEDRIKTLEALTEQLKSENAEFRSLVSVKNSEIDLNRSEISRKDAELYGKASEMGRLKSELERAQQLVSEKEKIIEVMAADSNQLHTNLVTIKGKLQEIGNVVDLGGKLKEEQKKSAQLLAENHELRAQMLSDKFSADSDIQRKLSDAEEKVQSLTVLLESEREMLRKTQREDIILIEQLRIQLNAALDKEEELENRLEAEQNVRSQLETKLETLKEKFAQPVSAAEEKTDSTTEYKSYGADNFELAEVRRQLLAEQQENLNLLQEIKEVKRERNEIESTLNFVKNQLAMENERARKLTENVEQLLREVGVVRQELVDSRLAVDRKARECADLELKIARLTHEKSELESKVASFNAVRSQLLDNVRMAKELYLTSREPAAASAHGVDNADLTAKLIADRKALEKQLADVERQHRRTVAEVLERNDYLFAKTLKLESLKKNLIWQKRYLTNYLNCHERYCSQIAAAPINTNDLGTFTWKPSKSRRFSNLNRFRAAVYSVIAIARMRIIVRKWEAKAAAIEHLNARHRSVSSLMEPRQNPVGDFKVGEPVNHRQFALFRRGRASEASGSEEVVDTPWSGATPPSKERARRRNRDNREMELRTPTFLAQYAERVEQIQERLGVALHSGDA